jgi:hypothetical protein
MSSNMIPLSLLSSRVLNNQIHSLTAIRLRRAVLWRTLWQRLTSLLASLSRRSRVSLLRMRLLRLVLPCYNSHCGVRYWTRRIARDDWRCREARASSIPSHYLCFVGGDHMILETVSTPEYHSIQCAYIIISEFQRSCRLIQTLFIRIETKRLNIAIPNP